MMEHNANAGAAEATRPSAARAAQAGWASSQGHVLCLQGCAPIPLASYLKALGILRLVAEQADPAARGCWRDDAFVLHTGLDSESLQRFFLEDYVPTPVIAPWNGGSGFHPGDNQSGIGPIEQGTASRLEPYRRAIQSSRAILAQHHADTEGESDAKALLLTRLRAQLDDDALAWLDAVYLLTEEKPKYPPLLGTGGNDGRLDFTNNFMQRLVAILDPDTGRPRAVAANLLAVSLYSDVQPGLPKVSIGQFAPGYAGGPNQTSGFSADPIVNPWDFILMIEGALMFAAAATRRLEHGGAGSLSYPFTVRSTGAGSGATGVRDEKNARAEMWLPLWRAPTTLMELRALLAEGRVTLGRRPVRDGLDFARAVARLGVERGISGFQRYAFLMRSGKAYFATPLNRVVVTRNRSGDLIDELEAREWLSRFRQLGRSHRSGSFASLVRKLDDALFTLTGPRGDNPGAVQEVLIVLGEVERYLGTSRDAREACPPVPPLSEQWAIRAHDGSPEFDLAAALASLHARQNDGNRVQRIMPMRIHIAPERPERGGYAWDENASHQVTWGWTSLESNLIATWERRLLEAERLQLEDKPFDFDHASTPDSVAAWLGNAIDHSRLASLLPGLALARIPFAGLPGGVKEGPPLPAAYRLLKPFFCTDAQLRRAQLLAADGCLPARAELGRLVMAGRTADALELAVRHLRAHGVNANLRNFGRKVADFRDGPRLLAALLVPIHDSRLAQLLPQPSTR